MTLIKMLLYSYVPMSEAQRESARGQFKEWLRIVNLPNYFSINRDGDGFNTTESLRKLLIILVDEP